MTPLALVGLNPNVAAFLQLITWCEGTDKQGTPYNELYGYGNFTSFARHPNIKVTKNGITSSAAGRYQFLYKTWQGLNLADFTPVNQDRGAILLVKQCGAYSDVLAGDWQVAITKCRKIWASFPGANYPGQSMRSMADCLKFVGAAAETNKKKA